MADHFKQRRAHIVIQILGGKFLLPRTGEPSDNICGEFLCEIGWNCMNEHWPLLGSDSHRSMIHAAKPRIRVLVMSLEPVAKRRPQHARGGARRATLHDEVLTIEEIRRVP